MRKFLTGQLARPTRTAGRAASSTRKFYESPEQLIYNHSFARALWGKEAPNCYCQVNGLDMWQYHLHQMIIADNPVAYLGEHI